ncbi:glycosyltransferase family 2 protein [Flavobacteriales bacterium]|nr:glycosyltransferase family 2 protein [Flavobacteriales bacterium]
MNVCPRVSIIMPAYNASDFIREAVDSILAQTFRDFELIILNDGSTDDTQTIVESYDDERIRLVNKVNSGVASTLNEGLKLAKGEFIWRHDADDISLPQKLERQIQFMEEHPEFDLCATQVAFMTERGKVAWDKRQPKTHWFKGEPYREVFFEDFSPYSPITHGTTLFRKAVLQKTPEYREAFITSEDIDMWLRFLNHSRLAVLNQCISLHRLSDSSATAVHGWKNHFYRELAKEFYLVRQKGEQDQLERTGQIIEPAPPKSTTAPETLPPPGRQFRGDLLGFHYSVHLNARDWKEMFTIVRLALRDGWKLRRTYRGIIFPWMPVWFIQLGVAIKSPFTKSR